MSDFIGTIESDDEGGVNSGSDGGSENESEQDENDAAPDNLHGDDAIDDRDVESEEASAAAIGKAALRVGTDDSDDAEASDGEIHTNGSGFSSSFQFEDSSCEEETTVHSWNFTEARAAAIQPTTGTSVQDKINASLRRRAPSPVGGEDDENILIPTSFWK